MIRLSQYAALHVLPQDIARDLDISPKLYMYSHNEQGKQHKLLVQEDTSALQQMTRNHAYAPFYSNVLLGTANFYPEQGLMIPNYHNNAELHEVLNDITLPIIEYKQAILYFSQGSVAMPNIVGHSIRIFCEMSNGSQVTIASVADFLNDSNITAQTPKLFDSQIWNEGIRLEYIDVEYLLSSDVPDVIAVRQAFFGNEKPVTLHIEYSAFTNDSVDMFTENGYIFTKLNLNVINQQSMPVTISDSELYSTLELSQDKFSIVSTLRHSRWNVESYMNTLKNELEQYSVKHQFLVNSYTNDDVLIESKAMTILNEVNVFDEQLIRPLINLDADHFEIECTIRIENVQTGLIVRRTSSIVITNANIQAFQPQHTFDMTGLQTYNLNTVVNKTINKIVHSPEFPKILQIEKRLYVQVQPLQELNLLDADFTAQLQTNIDITGNSKLHIKIDNLVIESEPTNMLIFKIPQLAYSTASKKYLLLNESLEVISSGNITKK